jgi:hypothetical protein
MGLTTNRNVYIVGTPKQLAKNLGLEKYDLERLLKVNKKTDGRSVMLFNEINNNDFKHTIFVIAQFTSRGEFRLIIRGSSPKTRNSLKVRAKEFIHACLFYKLTGSLDVWNNIYENTPCK